MIAAKGAAEEAAAVHGKGKAEVSSSGKHEPVVSLPKAPVKDSRGGTLFQVGHDPFLDGNAFYSAEELRQLFMASMCLTGEVTDELIRGAHLDGDGQVKDKQLLGFLAIVAANHPEKLEPSMIALIRDNVAGNLGLRGFFLTP